jgi:hypothetical protein
MKFALLILGMAIAGFSNAQTADEIIAKHIAAIGGKDKLDAVKTIYTEGEINIPNSPLGAVTCTTYRVNGKGFKEEISFAGPNVTLVESITDKTAWSVNAFSNKPKPGPLDDAQKEAGQAQLGLGSPLINYATQGSSVELLGKENINGTQAHKLKLVTKGGTEFTYLVDPVTYYILKMTVRNKNGDEVRSTIFSDYKKEEGIVLPFAAEFTIGKSTTMYLIINKAEINKDIDPAVFEMPKQ